MPAPVFLAPGPESILYPLGVEQGIPYTIIGPDGIRAVINDPADRDFVGYLDQPPTGLERAGVRENADTLPEADGGVHGSFYRDRLAFTLQGIIPPDADRGGTWLQRQAKLRRATNALRRDALLLWTPSEAPPVQVSFREQQPTRITGRRPKAFIVAGVAEDPVVVSQELLTEQIEPGVSSGSGFTSPLVSPLVSGAGTAGIKTVENVGDAEAWPVLTVYGPCLNPVLTNGRTGQSIVLAFQLAADEYLVIDTNPRRRSVRLNDVANRYSAYDFARSSWWPIYPGENELHVGFTTYSAGALWVVQWRHTWG